MVFIHTISTKPVDIDFRSNLYVTENIQFYFTQFRDDDTMYTFRTRRKNSINFNLLDYLILIFKSYDLLSKNRAFSTNG